MHAYQISVDESRLLQFSKRYEPDLDWCDQALISLHAEKIDFPEFMLSVCRALRHMGYTTEANRKGQMRTDKPLRGSILVLIKYMGMDSGLPVRIEQVVLNDEVFSHY